MNTKIGVIGSLVRDQIEIVQRQESYRQIGGGVLYAGHALLFLGVTPTLFPILAKKDRVLLKESGLPEEHLFPLWSDETTTNRCLYPEVSLDQREVTILSSAENIGWQPVLEKNIASLQALLLAPITQHEFAFDFYGDLRRNFKCTITIDVQGLVRGTPLHFEKLLGSNVDWLKADEDEILLLSGKSDESEAVSEVFSWGIGEIAVTRGSRGATVYKKDETVTIPAVPVNALVDATGCGDTFWGVYVAGRIDGLSTMQAGERAADVAAQKLLIRGPMKAVRT